MDKFSELCIKTNYIIDQIKPVSEFDIIFEAASSQQAKATDNKNKSLMARAGEGIKKIVHAILETIRMIKNKIRDFFVKLRMSKDEKAAYAAYRQRVAQSPSLKNVKVRAYDFKHKTGQYNQIMARLEAEERAAKANQITDQLKSMIEGFCKDVGSGVVTAVGMEQALNMASGNRKIAKKIYEKLESDELFYSKIEQNVGSKNAEKFKKDMGDLSKRAFFKRLKLQLTGHYCRTIESATLKTIRSCVDVVGGVKDVAGKDKNYVRGGKKIVGNSRMFKNMAGNESIGAAASVGKEIGKSAAKSALRDKAEELGNKAMRAFGMRPKEEDTGIELSKLSKSLHDAGFTKKEINPDKAQKMVKDFKKKTKKPRKVAKHVTNVASSFI